MKFSKMSFLVCCVGLLISNVAVAQTLGIGAGRQGSQNYAVNAGLAKFLSEVTELDVRVQAYGGSGQSMPLIDTGRLDIQLIPSPDVMAAFQGVSPFDGRALKNLRVITSLNSSAYGFMVRKDSEYESVSDLKGHSLTYGYTAQPTLRLQVDGILAAGGLSIDDLQAHMVPSVPNGVDDFISGNVDAAFFSLGGGKSREADATVGIRWLALDDTPEAEAAMQEFVPTSYIKMVEPAEDNVGVDKPTPMMSYDYALVAGKSVPEDVVQTIVEAMHKNPDKVRNIYKTFSQFSPEEMVPSFSGLTLQQGAETYYIESGLME
ncbi:TAXI family TRAP transporter solute-binding subunit [Halomonas sp. YLB-10]|uniref:TAXI family TRAP transporter solute-binding subunit n=1 Tax=unclassified Halomonas TaxID=2609666 RepID=UPI000F5E5993|nr:MULTISPECIES: TAXI family TRAP transporter solute-binding subunit [unclassified Halomonas]RQW68647.1 TAXI family TRAP transporter solute-binding subunit [Halomonas sp. YLB-10]